jgi:hypothetical protein
MGIPRVILPELRHHLAAFVTSDPGALAFPGAKAARCAGATSTAPPPGRKPPPRSGHRACISTTETLRKYIRGDQRRGPAGPDGRTGHDSERAALIEQHEAGGADAAITHAIDAHVDAERFRDNDDDDGQAGVLVPDTVSDLGLHRRAGDGNRTRTVSLGMSERLGRCQLIGRSAVLSACP